MSSKKVLFVCLGNICRSPAAEGIFATMVEGAGLKEKIGLDSAGTGGWHACEHPDPRMSQAAKTRGYDLSSLVARQFSAPEDFRAFDHILTMDESNLRAVRALDTKRQFHDKIQPLVKFCRIHSVREI